jgi:hypothetical protein
LSSPYFCFADGFPFWDVQQQAAARVTFMNPIPADAEL